MVDGIDVRLRRVNLFQPCHGRRRADDLHDQLGPEAGKGVQNPALLPQQGNRNRNDSEDDGNEPDERIEDQIRTQAAEPSVAFRNQVL